MKVSSGAEETNPPVPDKDVQKVSGFTTVRHEMPEALEPQYELPGDRDVGGSREDTWL